MNPFPSASEFSVDLESNNVIHRDGWVFRIVPSFGGSSDMEVVCVKHPTPVTPSVAKGATTLAMKASEAYLLAVARRHWLPRRASVSSSQHSCAAHPASSEPLEHAPPRQTLFGLLQSRCLVLLC